MPCVRLYASAGVLFAALASTAQAETDPYYLGASLARGHDSNVFRLPESANPKSDSYTTASLLAGFDQPISRQRFYGDLAIQRQRFDELDNLDNTGHKANAGWDWETIGNYSGTIKLSSEKSLASYSSLFGQTLEGLNLKRERIFDAQAQRGTARNDLQAFGAFNYRNTDYSSDLFRFRDNKRNALRLGARWHRSDLLTLGAAWVEARGKYQSVGIDYRSHAIELTGDWKPSSASTIDARVGYEQRKYDSGALQRNFSGVTGLLRWQWEPTGKLSFTTSLVRDSDDSERFVDTPAADLTVAGSRVTDSLILEGLWKATSKVSLNANLRYSDRSLVNPVGIQTIRGGDKTRLASLGATWAVTNNVSLGCSVGRQTRTTDSPDLSFPFKATTANCYVQALLKSKTSNGEETSHFIAEATAALHKSKSRAWKHAPAFSSFTDGAQR
jgi:hypothetical protein